MTTIADVTKERDETLLRVAKAVCDGASCFSDVTAADFGDVARRAGATIRKAGESPEQARVRFMKSDAGRTLLLASRHSAGPDHRATPEAAPLRADPAKAGPASQKVHDMAAALVLNESAGGTITPLMRATRHAAARVRIRSAHPELAAAESREQRAA